MSKILSYLKSGGDANIATISRKLEIDEGTVVLILDQLVKRGYLEAVIPIEELTEECTPIKCAGCSRASNCKPLLVAKYKIVEK